MASQDISQINSSIRTALGETAGTFRKASNDNNAMVGKIVKDLTRVFAQQKSQISGLNDNIEEVAHHSQQTSAKVDKLANIMSESLGLQSQMVSHMRNMVDGIQSTNRSIFGVQNVMGGSGGNSVLSKIIDLYNLFNTVVPALTGVATIALGVKVLMEKFGVSGQDVGLGGGGGGTGGGKLSEGIPFSGPNKPILDTIKARESSGNYQAQAKTSSASGAYQFVDDTWQTWQKRSGVGTNFAKAKDAPPEIQDKVADAYVSDILKRAGGDVSKVPLEWFTGNQQGTMSAKQQAANPGVTAQSYQANWLRDFQKHGGSVNTEAKSTKPGTEKGGAADGKGGGSESPLVTPSASDGSAPKGKGDAERVAHNHDSGIISGAGEQVKKETAGGLPSGNLVGLGKALQGQGLSVSEHPAFGGVKPGAHGRNSAHYKGDAIDVNIPGVGPEASNAQASAKFDKLADALTAAGYNVLWKVHGHYDHIHAQVGTQGVRGGWWKGGGGAASAASSTGAATPGATTPSTGMSDSTTPGSSPGATETPAASPLETSPFFSKLTGGTSYGELQGAITEIMRGGNPGGGTMGSIMDGASMGGFASALGDIPGMGSTSSMLSMLGPLMGIGGGSDTPIPEPVRSGEMLQSMSQSNQTSELNKQAVVREAQNQINTEMAVQTTTDKAVEDNNMRNSNRNEGRPILSDYNRPEDKGWPEWLGGFGTGVYDEFIRHSGGIRRA